MKLHERASRRERLRYLRARRRLRARRVVRSGKRASTESLPFAEEAAITRKDPHVTSIMAQMERAFGVSFSSVVLRTDAEAARRAVSMGAKAWSEGEEIGFAPGEFHPETNEGRLTLAHELAHVVQSRTPWLAPLAILALFLVW